MKKQPQIVEKRSLERVVEWKLNPRGGVYQGIVTLADSIKREGLQDMIHVWPRPDGDYLLKGHRRCAAMRLLEWTHCDQVVHEFEDEREAYQFLLEDHGHTVGLNAEEKIVAVEQGVKLGLDAKDLAPCLGLSVERVQLLFDLGEILPAAARSGLASGDLSLNMAELLLPVREDKKVVQEAAELMLKGEGSGPMTFAAAKSMMELRYLKPRKWREEWHALQVKLKKKMPVAEGFTFVEFDQRLEYVQGYTGQPQPGWELADEVTGGQTWRELAQGLGVPVYVCPAPLAQTPYVELVCKKMIREARDLRDKRDADDLGAVDERTVTTSEGANAAPAPAQVPSAPVAGDGVPSLQEIEKAAVADERVRRWQKVYLDAIYHHLLEKPTDAMLQEPWAVVLPWLQNQAEYGGLLDVWKGREFDLKAWQAGDSTRRAPMRHVLLLLLCLATDGEDERCYLEAMAKELGLDVARLNEQAEGE